MKTVLRYSRAARCLLWLTGFVVFAGFAFLPPVLGYGVKVAAALLVFAVPSMGVAFILAGLIFLVRNWRWTAAWLRWAAAWGWWGTRTAGACTWWALQWVGYGGYLLLQGNRNASSERGETAS